MLKEVIKELEELKEEMTLVELDNCVERICKSTTSIFDYDLGRDILSKDLSEGSCVYYISSEVEILIEFKMIKLDNSNPLDSIVKLSYTEELVA